MLLDLSARFREQCSASNRQPKLNMTIGRSILSIIVAAAIAWLPLVGGFARASAVSAATVVHLEMSLGSDIPQQMPMGTSDCQSNAGCAFKCFSAYHVALATPATRSALSEPMRPALTRSVDAISPHPPRRPPRA